MAETVGLISAVRPYPIDAGKKVVLAGLIEYFSERLGPENVHYLLIGGDATADFPVPLRAIPKPRARAALANVVRGAGTGRASLQESLLRSKETGEEITRVLQQLDLNLEIFDTVRTAQYASDIGLDKQICYLDDLFSERYAAMLRAAEKYSDVDIQPLGNFAEHVPRALRPIAENKRGQRALLRAERRLVERSEDRVARRFRRSLLVNSHEADLLRRRARVGEDQTQSIPPLISTPTRTDRDYQGAPEFVFLGLLSLPHNDDGLRSFIDLTWPKLLAERPDAILRIFGRDPLPGLVAAVAQHPGSVFLEGFAPDLSAVLTRAAAMINPLRFGSGIKLKVIEALGRGIPVVSTPIGADGISSGPQHGVLVADSTSEFMTHLLDLTSPAYNAAISDAARNHFDAEYSREAVFALYDRAFTLS
ncbi:glycosyltransferase family 4 protein [Williamsia sp. 1135]|uniref:glycosyltransferase family 4 protein n=1 Tax=Williamsia sp. 1135 TaxID=1889262 RepID=UPI000A108EB6|nr:glycosyltransferase family 4 protein [Williamsia sp. 1135]ORM37594.1 glycosyl transferase family 1 [Williamsia sp. 1135]